MLGKLMKHEFRATGRIMLPVLGIVLLAGLGGNIALRIMEATQNHILNFLAGLLLAAFFIAMIAAGIVVLVVMINRFRTNLLGDEGYVMFTLPASVHQQVWSKLLVSTVWFLVTGIAMCLSVLILLFRVQYVHEAVSGLQQLFSQLNAYYAVNSVAFILELLALTIVSCIASCLMFYAAMAVGHTFASHKALLSVAFFILFTIVIEIIGTISFLSTGGFLWGWIGNSTDGVMAIHAIMVAGIVSNVLYGAVFYLLTTYMLKRHLNLE